MNVIQVRPSVSWMTGFDSPDKSRKRMSKRRKSPWNVLFVVWRNSRKCYDALLNKDLVRPCGDVDVFTCRKISPHAWKSCDNIVSHPTTRVAKISSRCRKLRYVCNPFPLELNHSEFSHAWELRTCTCRRITIGPEKFATTANQGRRTNLLSLDFSSNERNIKIK